MVEPINDEYYDVITIKGKEDTPKCKTPFVLKGHVYPSSKPIQSKVCVNFVTQSYAKIVLKGLEPTNSTPKSLTDCWVYQQESQIGPLN